MAIRLQSEFRTLKDDQYRIKIIDSAFTGTPTDVNVGGDGFTLTHDGETDTLFSPIIGSSVSVSIYNDDPAVDAFRTALLNAQDKQFSIRIERWEKPRPVNIEDDFRNRVIVDGGAYEGGECVQRTLAALGVGTDSRTDVWASSYGERVTADGGVVESASCVVSEIESLGGATTVPDEEFTLYWTGYITQDLIEEADESKPRQIRITAADGISLLSTLEHAFTSPTLTTFKDAFIELFAAVDIDDLYSADEPILTSVVNWYSEEHTYSTTLDPFANSRADLKAFSFIDRTNARTWENAIDFIREVCLTFAARFYYSDGSYRFEQIGERDNEVIREFKYLKSGVQDSVQNITHDAIVDGTNIARSGGTFRYLPAQKKVNLTLSRLSSANLIGRQALFPGDEIGVGVIPSIDNGRVSLSMNARVQTFISNPLQGTATPVYGVTIRLEPSDGTANQWWKSSVIVNSLAFGIGSWSTTQDTFKFAGNTISRATSLTTSVNYSMVTGPLPKDGEIFIDIDFLGFYSFGLEPTFITAPNSYAVNITLNTAQFENDNNPSDIIESVYTAVNTNPNLGGQLELDMGSTRLGDGPGALGSLRVNNGSAYVTSTGWRIGNDGVYLDAAKLSTKEILSLQNKVVSRFEATFIGSVDFHDRLKFDSAFWVPMRATKMANFDEVSIECFKIAKESSLSNTDNDAVDVPSDGRVASNVADYNGAYQNIAAGNVANMPVDFEAQSIGPYKQELDGTATITEDLTVQGAADAPSLRLTGGTGTQGTLEWSTDEESVSLDTGGAKVYFDQDVVYNVRNNTGSDIDKGVAVMATGTLGASGRITIAPMDATGDIAPYFYLGITAQEIANGEDGKVVQFGKIRQLDTSAWTAGDVLWLDPTTAGGLTVTEPSAPALKIAAAFVIHSSATVGSLAVRVSPGYNLGDLHNVEIDTPTDGQVLKYNATTRIWYNADLI